MRLPQWRWRACLLALAMWAVVTALVACGEGGEEAPTIEQKMVIQSLEPQYLDPYLSRLEHDIAVERMLFRGLYQLVAEGKGVEAVPAMAQGEPAVSSDGLTYTVKLKPGLKWSDGQALTASDFEFGIKRGCDPDVGSPYGYLLQSAAEGGIIGVEGCDEFLTAGEKSPTEKQALREAMGVKAMDDTTLEITLAEPKLPLAFKQIFSLWVTFPARQDLLERYGDRWTDAGKIQGNGPYILTSYRPNEQLTLEPNPNWALEPKPKLQELTIKFIDNLDAAFRAFQTGELDVTRIGENDVQTARGDSALKDQLLVVGSSRIWAVEMHMKRAPLDKYEVRLALSKAIDRDTLVKVVYGGVNLPAEYWLVKGLPGFQGRDKFKPQIGYDPEGAKKALSDAGFPDGQGFPTLSITVADTPARRAEAEFLKNAWKTILNIDVEIRALDAKSGAAAVGSGNFELLTSGMQLDYPDPENLLVGLFNTGGGNNTYECSDPEIDRAIQEASAATSVDDHVRLFQKVEDLVVSRLCGVAPIWQGAIPYLVSSKVGGVNANGTIDAGMPGNWCAECWFIKK